MKLKFIDIHSHLQFPQFDSDREEVIEKMKNSGVGAIVVGTDFESSKKAVELANNHENLWASVGLHPNDNTTEIFNFDAYKKLAENSKVVAIGECGLDYFRCEKTSEEKRRQAELFELHIKLSVESNLPLMIHVRDAYEDVIKILQQNKKEYGDKLRGNVHFFAGDLSTAKSFFEMGFSTSFTGVITFTNDYDEVIKSAPIDMIMTETDCPYVAPEPHRGKRCKPVYVEKVAQRIAEVRGEEIDNIKDNFLENTERMFGIK
ncbi:TatD family hydrolase [Patescibacteria group bacterium]